MRVLSPDFLKTYWPSSKNSLAATSRASTTSVPALKPALPIASITTSSASWFDLRFGAKPPSSPTPVARPRFFRMPRRAWKISAPTRSASLNELAPTGITMNSWKSTLVSACAPPLRMLHIGTGSRSARAPPTIAWRSAPMCSKSGTRSSAAAARRAAIDTASVALAPSRPLLAVPSRAIIASSSAAWFSSLPMTALAISPLMLATAVRTPLPE